MRPENEFSPRVFICSQNPFYHKLNVSTHKVFPDCSQGPGEHLKWIATSTSILGGAVCMQCGGVRWGFSNIEMKVMQICMH